MDEEAHRSSEIHVPGHINFKWNHSNLDNGRKLGKAAAEQAIKAYDEHQAQAARRSTFHKRESRGTRLAKGCASYHEELKRTLARRSNITESGE